MKFKPAFQVLLIFIFLIGDSNIFASSLSVTPNKTTLVSLDDELSVNTIFQIDVSDDKKYYLRGVFYQPDSTNYCGYTWNGTNWFSGPYSSGEGWKQFFPITIKSSSWSGEIKVKIDPSDSGCRESRDYHFKIQRFTESGSASFDSQNEVVINVLIPTATLTLAPTLIPTIFLSPTSTALPSKTPTPAKTPTVMVISNPQTTQNITSTKQTAKISVFPTFNNQIEASKSPVLINATPAGEVIGIQSNIPVTNSDATPIAKLNLSLKPLIVSLLLIGLGLGILAVAYIYKNSIKLHD